MVKLMFENIEKITRFEVIDENGRSYMKYNVHVEPDLQDDGRTLKIFISKRTKNDSE